MIISHSPPTFPPGKWVPVFTPTSFEHVRGVKWQDGWLVSNIESFSCSLRDIGTGRSHGIRATIREGKPSAPTALQVRVEDVDSRADSYRAYQLRLASGGIALEYYDHQENGPSKSAPIGKGVWPKLGIGEPVRVEIVVIGTRIFTRLNGQLSEGRDDRIEKGNVGFSMGRQAIRDVEVINLDVLSEAEALKAAGIEDGKQ